MPAETAGPDQAAAALVLEQLLDHESPGYDPCAGLGGLQEPRNRRQREQAGLVPRAQRVLNVPVWQEPVTAHETKDDVDRLAPRPGPRTRQHRGEDGRVRVRRCDRGGASLRLTGAVVEQAAARAASDVDPEAQRRSRAYALWPCTVTHEPLVGRDGPRGCQRGRRRLPEPSRVRGQALARIGRDADRDRPQRGHKGIATDALPKDQFRRRRQLAGNGDRAIRPIARAGGARRRVEHRLQRGQDHALLPAIPP